MRDVHATDDKICQPLKIICVKSRLLLLLFRATFQRVAVTVFRWGKRMRTCRHMSPGCSSPRDLNLAPARHYCCHSQTHSDLLTSAAQKRLDALTHSRQMSFTRAKKKKKKTATERASERAREEREREERGSAQFEDSGFVFLAPKKPFEFRLHWLKAGRWLAGATIRRLDISQHLMRGNQGSEVRVWRPPTCVMVELRDVSSAGSCLATCGQCAPSHRSLSLPLTLDCSGFFFFAVLNFCGFFSSLSHHSIPACCLFL